jgi:chromate transporter
MAVTTHPPLAAEPRQVTLTELFVGFLSIGLRGFGGVLPWARLMIVEERQWLSEAEFAELFSLYQLLPGPNVLNLSIALGTRFHGVAGAVTAFTGLMTMPLTIVLSLGALYNQYGRLPALDPVFHNLGAAAAGMVVASGFKMATPHWRKKLSLAVAFMVFVAVGLIHWPLIWVVVAMIPLSISLHWRRGR